MRVTLREPKSKEELEQLSHAQLVDLSHKLWAVVKAQQTQLEELRRLPYGGASRAKQSRRGRRKSPGRKSGQGHFGHRTPPSDDEVTKHEEVPAPDICPGCGSAELELERHEDAWTTDIPDTPPKPEVTHFTVPVCRCRSCGKTDIRGKHPKVAADQRGATAHRVGPNAFAAAHGMHYGYGVTVRKTVPILRDLTGVHVTQSAITQDAIRRARGELKPRYEELRHVIRHSHVAHTDDTGMPMGGKVAYLMGFSTPDTEAKPGVSFYQTRQRHRNEEVREVLPAEYQGTMVTDRGRAYDAKALDGVKQQKCITHILRNLDAHLETKVGAARDFGERLSKLFRTTLKLWHSYHEGRRRGFQKRAQKLKEALTVELRDREFTDSDNQRFLNELGYHHDRGNLLRFLDDPSIPPTNNFQEGELKVPIQARKVSQGVKTPTGAFALDVHSSIIRTEQRKHPPSLIQAVAGVFTSAKKLFTPALPLPT